MKVIKENNIDIDNIISALENGAVLVLPTDTVYGLICDAGNNQAVEKIFKIKKRDKSKTLPIFVEDLVMAEKFAVIGKNQQEIIRNSWPGATTFVLKLKKPILCPLLYKEGTIALRVPNHDLIKEIFKEFKKPLAQTSANISGESALTRIEEIINNFTKSQIQPDLIIDAGDLPKNNPSVIIDLTKDKINILRK